MKINNTPGCRVIAWVSDTAPAFPGYRIECHCERRDHTSNAWQLRYLRPTGRAYYSPDSITLTIGRRFQYAHPQLRRHLARVFGVERAHLKFTSDRRRNAKAG
jgi:hypothetical protein